MRPRTRLTAAVLAAAALAPAAMVGSSALAASGSSASTGTSGQRQAAGDRRGPDLTALAAKLGVSQSDLRSALDALRPAGASPQGEPGKGPGDMAAKLAAALNVSTDRVTAILEANRPTTRPAPGTRPDMTKLVSALSSGLGIDQATVRTALTKLRPPHGGRGKPGADFPAKLAAKLGLQADTVKAALDALRPAQAGYGGRGAAAPRPLVTPWPRSGRSAPMGHTRPDAPIAPDAAASHRAGLTGIRCPRGFVLPHDPWDDRVRGSRRGQLAYGQRDRRRRGRPRERPRCDRRRRRSRCAGTRHRRSLRR